MLSREELLEAAPEGVSYVWVEPCSGWDGYRVFWYDDQWGKAGVHQDAPDPWHLLLRRSIGGSGPAEELSRRFAAQANMLIEWIEELGLLESWCEKFNEHCGQILNYPIWTLTPQQQEGRPRLAMKFLKEHFAREEHFVGGTLEEAKATMEKLYVCENIKPTPSTAEEGQTAKRAEGCNPKQEETKPHKLTPDDKLQPRDKWGNKVDTRGFPK
jgi:hypothetical protein